MNTGDENTLNNKYKLNNERQPIYMVIDKNKLNIKLTIRLNVRQRIYIRTTKQQH